MSVLNAIQNPQANPIEESSMSILDKIQYAENVEAYVTTIHAEEWDIHGLNHELEINFDGESITIDGADPMFSEALCHISPLDVYRYRHSLSRKNLHDYCRVALALPYKEHGMELVEDAVRIVQNIEKRPANWKGDTRA